MDQRKNRKITGFTIVELLIVIVVIAILATISIVGYNGIQNRANDAIVKVDLGNIAKQYELFKVDDSSGVYPDTPEDLQSLNLSVSKDAYLTTPGTAYNVTACTKGSGTSYAIGAMSKSGKKYSVSNETGVQEYTGASDWTATYSSSAICSSSLAGSAYVGSGGHLYYQGWRAWAK